MRTLRRWIGVAFVAGVAWIPLELAVPAAAEAQVGDLTEYDYEYLRFRGIGLDAGYIFPSTVESTHVLGGRVDLGYLGPGIRLMAVVSRWSSRLNQGEVSRFERQLEDLYNAQRPDGTPPITLDLGEIGWSDWVVGLDGHVMWSMPLGLLGYTGVGLAAHVMNGDGVAIQGTFVEDLLDSVRAGVNAHLGVEVPLHEKVRLYGDGRFDWLGDLYYFGLRGGVQVFVRRGTPTDHPAGAP